MNAEQKELLRRKRILDFAENCGNVNKACRYFGVSCSNFYLWRAAFQRHGDVGLIRKKPIPKSHPNQTPTEVIEKVLYLRQNYHMGPIRIVWYLQCYHDIKISDAGVYRILRRNGVSRLPRNIGRRAVYTKRYEKQVPGHHIQVDVKFLIFRSKDGAPIKRYQYTAIDDATRIRALKVYKRHNQANAIDFVDHLIGKFPIRIQCICTDRGHEFQAKFHWHVEDRGIRQAYIKPRTPSSTARSSDLTAPTRRSFINCSIARTTFISIVSWPSGKPSKTSSDLTAPSKERRLTKLLGKNYNQLKSR